MAGSGHFAWVEYGTTGDGVSFCQSLSQLGRARWRNVFTGLRRKGRYFKDEERPSLPIYRVRERPMARPNDSESLYQELRQLEGSDAATRAIEANNDFLARWVFSPGVDSRASALTTDRGRMTTSADWVGVSGHGSGMRIWGDGLNLRFKPVLSGFELDEDRASPQYIIVTTCNNLSRFFSVNYWAKLFRQQNPVRGVLGYMRSYPGEPLGEELIGTFFGLMIRKNRTVLQAWKEANELHAFARSGRRAHLFRSWGAVMHEEAVHDSLLALGDGLARPNRAGAALFFDHSNFGRGQASPGRGFDLSGVTLQPIMTASFVVDGVRITGENQGAIGILPGQVITLRLEVTEVTSGRQPHMLEGDPIEVAFNFHREDHEGLNLEALLDVDGTRRLVRDQYGARGGALLELLEMRRLELEPYPWLNREPPAKRYKDTIKFTPPRATTALDIPLKIHPRASTFYKPSGRFSPELRACGLFWVRLVPPPPLHQRSMTSEDPLYRKDDDGTIPFPGTGFWLVTN